jgi:hypothetical protein
MVNNKEFMEYLEESFWWKVDSSTDIDDRVILIELKMLEIIDHTAPALEDGYPPRREQQRFRLYRIATGSQHEPPREYLSEEFAMRCWDEREQLGYPVLVTCQGEKDSRHPIDWLTTIRVKDCTVFINAFEKTLIDTVKAFALAFNRRHMGAWEYLPKGNKWHFCDEEFSYEHNYRSEGEAVPDHQDPLVRLVQLHARLGDMTPGLFQDEDGAYVPMVMNEQTREGFEFRASHGGYVRISTKRFSENIPVILLRRETRMEGLVPDTVYDIMGWSVWSIGDFVIDVDIASTPSDGETVLKRYRLPIGDLQENLRNKHLEVLLCQSLDRRSTNEIRDEKRVLLDDKMKLERFWTEKIFCNPWIDTCGNLRSLNGATFPASWIVRRGTIVEES